MCRGGTVATAVQQKQGRHAHASACPCHVAGFSCHAVLDVSSSSTLRRSHRPGASSTVVAPTIKPGAATALQFWARQPVRCCLQKSCACCAACCHSTLATRASAVTSLATQRHQHIDDAGVGLHAWERWDTGKTCHAMKWKQVVGRLPHWQLAPPCPGRTGSFASDPQRTH